MPLKPPPPGLRPSDYMPHGAGTRRRLPAAPGPEPTATRPRGTSPSPYSKCSRKRQRRRTHQNLLPQAVYHAARRRPDSAVPPGNRSCRIHSQAKACDCGQERYPRSMTHDYREYPSRDPNDAPARLLSERLISTAPRILLRSGGGCGLGPKLVSLSPAFMAAEGASFAPLHSSQTHWLHLPHTPFPIAPAAGIAVVSPRC